MIPTIHMTNRPFRMRLAVLLLAGAAIAAPLSVRLDPDAGLRLTSAMAFAKDGDRGGDDSGGRGGDDRGGDDHGGRGGDDRGGDDHGGRGGDDRGGDDHGGRGGDNRGGDDHGGRGRGRDDGHSDDHGGHGRGRDDRPSGTAGGGTVGGGAAGSRPTEIERSARGIEVSYADGWREELENGRYELKDAQGRTVVERRATTEDMQRLSAFSR
ncbi:hypothetical protein CP157_03194 (plasmid) [Paracoccus marcusii]|uniref:hypothetical protein n=1 Tax=Paracoccus marcusii TaxID=59779 RepID=UPI001C3DBC30|nr:hypothetical protein [Paracoccus marcusii]QXI65405.1 hypothetical protein CP157_03194 [Paracoccus marcusii]